MSNSNRIRVALIQKASLLLFGGTLAGAIVVNLLPNQPWQLGAWSLVNIGIAIVMVALAYKQASYPYNGHILAALCMYAVFTPCVLSGGVNSQFSVLIPILPIIFFLVINQKTAWIIAGGSITAIILMGIGDLTSLDLTGATHEPFQRVSHMVWLIIATIVSFSFSLIYASTNTSLNKKIKSQAYNDVLTGISNKRSILKFAETSLFSLNKETDDNEQKVLSILAIDVDNLASINKTYGQDIGDECLQKIARTLRKSIREDSDSIGRYEGGKFIICLLTETHKQAESVAQKLCSAVSQIKHKRMGQSSFSSTVSIGLMSVASSAGIDVNSIIALADQALLRAKQSGRSKVVTFNEIRKTQT